MCVDVYIRIHVVCACVCMYMRMCASSVYVQNDLCVCVCVCVRVSVYTIGDISLLFSTLSCKQRDITTPFLFRFALILV